MVTVLRWSGREARVLRDALRMSVRDFAAYLGVSDRTVSNWEAGGVDYQPRGESQAVLDTALDRASDDVKARFAAVLGTTTAVPSVPGGIEVDSHKFLPVFIGVEGARRLRAHLTSSADDQWLESCSARVDHPEAQDSVLHVFACGVAIFHLVQPREPPSLTELAVWRYRSYSLDLLWARDKLSDLLGRESVQVGKPEYVLSLYWLTSGPWTGDAYSTAVRLLSTPSILVDRGAPGGPAPLDGSVEESLYATGFDHPDIVSFGVRGVSTGYASWSGVAYASHCRERSLTIDELVRCELAVQALWCFTRQIQQMVEDGQDPSTPDEYGWRFLRAAYSRLSTARAQETAQHVLMREAIMKTSGLAERLRAAQDALREGAG
ncbi:helix-turn-helix domain-containing protein [Amycolatopsis sp. NPDC004625]|uniref:helix-turn-helix domain-containing protein n=1 Tax=Amycolatopsis sp. NPDC004625 TaxID=3154670 RepID=UPI0033B34D40